MTQYIYIERDASSHHYSDNVAAMSSFQFWAHNQNVRRPKVPVTCNTGQLKVLFGLKRPVVVNQSGSEISTVQLTTAENKITSYHQLICKTLFPTKYIKTYVRVLGSIRCMIFIVLCINVVACTDEILEIFIHLTRVIANTQKAHARQSEELILDQNSCLANSSSIRGGLGCVQHDAGH